MSLQWFQQQMKEREKEGGENMTAPEDSGVKGLLQIKGRKQKQKGRGIGIKIWKGPYEHVPDPGHMKTGLEGRRDP